MNEITNDITKKFLKNKDIKFIMDRVGTEAEAKSQIKELELIYPSLVGLSENQERIEIEVPNGKWVFKADK